MKSLNGMTREFSSKKFQVIMKAILKLEIIALLILIYSNLMAQQKLLTRKDLLNAIVNQKFQLLKLRT